jgi:hypothetical protein
MEIMIPFGLIEVEHEYFVVELNNIEVPSEVIDWLYERIGDNKKWFYKHPKIYFYSKHDHMMFLLRWG